ncbi:hypothetical protein GCM10010452_29020 [Crossiella cryophila]
MLVAGEPGGGHGDSGRRAHGSTATAWAVGKRGDNTFGQARQTSAASSPAAVIRSDSACDLPRARSSDDSVSESVSACRFGVHRRTLFTVTRFAASWCKATSGGAVSVQAALIACSTWAMMASIIAATRASRVANRRCTVVRATPAALAICRTVVVGSALSKRSATRRNAWWVRSASARSGGSKDMGRRYPAVASLREYATWVLCIHIKPIR